MFSFGSGVLIGTRNDIANGTPINFGLIQDVQFEDTASIKELYGQYQFAVAIARGTRKLTGKASVARISGVAMASLFYGVNPTAGQTAVSFAEAGTIPGSVAYTVTVANSATFLDDDGVVYALTQLPFTKVASAPTAGQYSVSTSGVYTFAAADANAAVLISYTYTISASGQSIPVNNQLLGATPTFQCQFYSTFQGQNVTFKLFNATSSKLSFATKLEDFVIPEFDFEAFANASGQIGLWSFSEKS